MTDIIPYGSTPLGGWIALPGGTTIWCGRSSWREQLGAAILHLDLGSVREVENCLLPDGTRGSAFYSIDHKYDLSNLLATRRASGRVPKVFKRQGAGGRFVFGKVEIGPDDVHFVDLPELARRKKPDLHGLEADLHGSERIRSLAAAEDFARRLYGALCNTQWQRGEDSFECSWRYAGGLVADLRALNESYTDFYLSGNEGEIDAEVERELNTLGWTCYAGADS